MNGLCFRPVALRFSPRVFDLDQGSSVLKLHLWVFMLETLLPFKLFEMEILTESLESYA